MCSNNCEFVKRTELPVVNFLCLVFVPSKLVCFRPRPRYNVTALTPEENGHVGHTTEQKHAVENGKLEGKSSIKPGVQ